MASTETVKVIVRSRPLSKSERDRGNYSIIEFDRSINQVAITDTKTHIPKTFAYDSVFDDSFTQQQLYDESAYPLVQSTLQGYNSTIFAYGQTGCGKTYTMLGVPNDPNLRGIIPNSFSHIFGSISQSNQDKMFLVRCSYIEIYNEEIRDLLNYDVKNKLELKEGKDHGIVVKNLSMHIVKSINDIGAAMENGNDHRITKQTNMNEKSSRSHAIFTIYIETSEQQANRMLIKAGKLNLVDLAGSERQKKTGAEGDRLKEAIKINLSLSALGNVINALVEASQHVPYRDSKLTLLLQDSLGGNTKTLMIAVVSPADYNYDESLSTLRYASRAKFIKNKPKINEDPKDALLREYALEINKLKKMLEQQEIGEPIIVERVVERYVEVPIVRKRTTLEYPDDFEDIEEDFQTVVKRNSIRMNTNKNSNKFVQNPSVHRLEDSLLESSDQKTQIARMMTEINNQFIKGGEALDKAEQERLKAQKLYRKKLRKQKNKEKKLLEENRIREEEVIIKGKEYENMQEELEDLRRVKAQLKVKCKAASSEINDLNHEFEVEKEEILENYRNKQAENEFLQSVALYVLPGPEIRNIRSKSKYDAINKKWKIPAFIIQNKSAFFPKIGGAQVKDALQDKVLRFKDSTPLKKGQKDKKIHEKYFSEQPDARNRLLNDNISPPPLTFKQNGNQESFSGGNIPSTDKPNRQKVFLQPINQSRKQLANNYH